MIAAVMKLSRTIFFPLFLAFVMLFAQQAGAAHALHHALDDLSQHQKDKQAPHTDACEKCSDYTQLGSALNVSALDFILLAVSDVLVQHRSPDFRSALVIPAVARGPPPPRRIA